jgi:lysophospholipase L1-like esterase
MTCVQNALRRVFLGVEISLIAVAAGGWIAGPTALAQAIPAAQAPQVQPAEVGSPTDPKRGERMPLPVPKDPKLPTLFLVGDSTVRNGQGNGAGGQWGWGEPLVDDFDPTKINVVNRAIGGLSSRTYMNAPDGGPWAATLALIKPGDVVLIQFGHNDGGKPDDPSRARASLPGVGEETMEIENPILKMHETVHSYGWYLRKIVEAVKAKGATAIVCSPIPRKTWKNGKVVRNADNFGGWARQVAAQKHVGFVDLNEIIARRYDALGEAAVDPLFADPHTHTSRAGAELNAECVVSGLKALKNNPVAEEFSAKGAAVNAYQE